MNRLVYLCKLGNYDLVKRKLDDKTITDRDLTIPDIDGHTPFRWICFYGYTKIAYLIINL